MPASFIQLLPISSSKAPLPWVAASSLMSGCAACPTRGAQINPADSVLNTRRRILLLCSSLALGGGRLRAQQRGRPTVIVPDAGTVTRSLKFLTLIRPLGKSVGELGRELVRFVLFDLVLAHELRQKSAVDPSCDVVSSGDGKEGAGVVVEADRVVKAGGLSRLFAKAQHALGTVVEPPR